MRPRRTFPAVPNDLREWTRYLSDLFFAREFDAELGGCTTVPTGTARYTVSAGIVCLAIPEMTGTSNSTLAFIETLPDEITPDHDQYCYVPIIDNGVTAMGRFKIGTDTGITLSKDMDGGVFTAAGTKGIRQCVVVFPLD